MEVSQNYIFKLSSIDGSWLYLDYELIIDNGGIHKYKTVENSIKLEKSLYNIRVCYMKYQGNSGIELMWMGDDFDDFFDPSDHFYYIPQELFDYTYLYSEYTVNTTITKNIPIYYDIPSPMNCTAYPPLPEGLYFDEGCIIAGYPKEIQSQTTYYINETNTGYNTLIRITILDKPTLDGLYFINKLTGEKFVDYNFTLGLYYDLEIKNDYGYVLYYSFSDFPDFFTYNNDDFSIKGMTNKELYTHPKNITVYAYVDNNNYVKFNIIWYIKRGCKGLEDMHVIKLNSDLNPHNSTYVTLKYHNGTESYSSIIKPGINPSYSIAKCMYEDEYIFSTKDNNIENNNNNFMFYSNGKLVYNLTIPTASNNEYNISTKEVKPNLQYYQHYIFLYHHDNVLIEPIYPLYLLKEPCNVVPSELPEGLSLSPECIISGVVEGHNPLKGWTVFAKNEFGESLVLLQISASKPAVEVGCKVESKYYIKFIITTGNTPSSMKYRISNSYGEIYDVKSGHLWEKNQTYIYSNCLFEGSYKIEVEDLGEDGWDGNIEVTLDDVHKRTFKMRKGEKYKYDYVNSIFYFNNSYIII